MSEAPDRLYQMIAGFRVTQMVRAAALLGICDALGNRRRESGGIAAEVGADPGLLQRLMRGLAGIGVLTEEADGVFANTELGELLRSDTPGNLRNVAIGLPSEAWAAWAEFPRGVREGRIPFQLAHGQTLWELLATDPAKAASFNAFMASQTAIFVPQLLEAFDFTQCARVVDVGGGNGALIAGVLSAHPSLKGTLFDLEAGLDGADAYLRERGVRDRCDLSPGSFFDSIPRGGDAYMLKLILHDWEDHQAAEILSTCRRAMEPGSRLLVIDHILPRRALDNPRALVMDMHMYALFGARERTEDQLRQMLAGAGFQVERVVSTSPPSTIVAQAI